MNATEITKRLNHAIDADPVGLSVVPEVVEGCIHAIQQTPIGPKTVDPLQSVSTRINAELAARGSSESIQVIREGNRSLFQVTPPIASAVAAKPAAAPAVAIPTAPIVPSIPVAPKPATPVTPTAPVAVTAVPASK